MKTLGQILRSYREDKGLFLREVASSLNMDTALLSKFERDERKPNKRQVISFAKYYGVKEEELLLAWISDKIADDIQNVDFAKQVLKVAELKIDLYKSKKNG